MGGDNLSGAPLGCNKGPAAVQPDACIAQRQPNFQPLAAQAGRGGEGDTGHGCRPAPPAHPRRAPAPPTAGPATERPAARPAPRREAGPALPPRG